MREERGFAILAAALLVAMAFFFSLGAVVVVEHSRLVEKATRAQQLEALRSREKIKVVQTGSGFEVVNQGVSPSVIVGYVLKDSSGALTTYSLEPTFVEPNSRMVFAVGLPGSENTSWLSGWAYRKPITVTAGAYGMPENYQFLVVNPIFNENGLVGSWHLNEGAGTTAYDNSGNGNNGTLVNGPTWVDGKFGKALQFDGSDDYVQYPKAVCDAVQAAQKVTISLWFKWNALATNRVLVIGADGAGYYLHTNSSDATKIDFEIYYSGSWYKLTSATSVSAGVWYHIVATWDGSIMKLYFNGAQDPNTLARTAMSDRASSGDRTFSSLSSSYVINGVMDDVRIYNRALSAEEVLALYQAKANPDYDDIRFTKADGTTLLNYFMEADGKFWVRDADALSANASHTIYLYYGNPSATSLSNADATFDLYDDFNDGVFDTGKWTKEQRGNASNWSVTESGGILSIRSGTSSSSPYANEVVYSNANFGLNYAVEVRLNNPNWGGTGSSGYYRSADWGFRKSWVSPDDGAAVYSGEGGHKLYAVANGSSTASSDFSGSYPPNSWRTYTLIRYSSYVRLYTGTTLIAEVTSNIGTAAKPLIFSTSNWSTSYPQGSLDIDWVRVRKYVPAEPTVSIGAEQGDLSGWTYKRKITIDHTKVDADLTDFPVAVLLTADNFDFSKARPDGYDIRFTAADGKTLLSFERVRHDASGQKAEYYVKIPAVSSSADTEFYLYYGNSNASDISNPVAVWSNGYKAVYHMDDWTASAIKDSTGNNNGTKKGTNEPIEADGKIGKAQQFDGSDDYVNLPDLNLHGSAGLTVEAWVKGNSWSGSPTIVFFGDGTSGGQWSVILQVYNNKFRFGLESGSTDYNTNGVATLSVGTWYHLVAVKDGTTTKTYINGTQDDSGTAPSTTNDKTYHRIGVAYSSYYWSGIIDEVRISNVARSAAWLKATYNSLNNTLLTVGNEAPLVSSATLGVVTQLGNVFWVQ